MWPAIIGMLLVLIAFFVASRRRQSAQAVLERRAAQDNGGSIESVSNSAARKAWPRASSAATAPPATAEEIVAAKMKQFARSRREIMRAMATQKKISIPDGVERFFDAVEGGDWTEIEGAFHAINGGDGSAGQASERRPEVTELWASIIDAYGVAEQVHLWPAQKLLDYGNVVLGSLRPGMVYVGGTDEGRWVPTLLNETSEGERRIVITQNGLADGTYLEYLRFLYADRIQTLSSEDSQRAFNEYIKDAEKRLAHDEKFPDEPKQIREREQISVKDGHTSVGGIVAVMDINERLLKILMGKNPEVSFGLQESFPMKGTYADAAPLGPITELRAQDQSSFTAERVADSVKYWQGVAEQFRAAPDDSEEKAPSKSFSKLAVGQANLFAERGFSESAEQTYRIALGITPSNADAVTGLAELFQRNGRADDARKLVEQFGRDYPKQAADLKRFLSSGSVIYRDKR
jgi:tetratricopeptide (TPR) repeat protein